MVFEMKIETLEQFYAIMSQTKISRKKIVQGYLNKSFFNSETEVLKNVLSALESIPEEKGKKYLFYEGKNIYMDLDYEIGELKKDIYFLEHGEEEFTLHLKNLNRNFNSEMKEGIQFLQGLKFKNFITDRDGTVNNYCGRYRSSIQSIYNAVFITRFAIKKAENSLLLSSAPLRNGGLVEVSVIPEGVFIFSGSKGREYIDRNGIYNCYPVESKRQKLLNHLNQYLKKMVSQPEYEIFSLIGSGLQFKVGQTTIARQDIYGSIQKERSEEFLEKIKKIINEIDPDSKYLRIEDTGKDIEIMVTVEQEKDNEIPRDFNKGDGVRFMNYSIDLELEKGSNLVCGDTESDIPMLKAVLEMSPLTRAIFVTEKLELKEKVSEICPKVFFVTAPDILVSILNQTAKGIKIEKN